MVSPIQGRVAWGVGLEAGVVAGIGAALACAATGYLMGGPLPPPVPAAGSAFAAGVLGGLIYVWLARHVNRPQIALLLITLALAAADSLLICFLPLPDVVETPPHLPIYGLLVPLRMIGALMGIGRFGHEHFPSASIAQDIAMHFVTALAVSLLVPWWAGRRDKREGGSRTSGDGTRVNPPAVS